MRKFVLWLLLLLLPVCAHAEYWEDAAERPAVCCDDRPGCQVLQTVMLGSFADFDPADGLNVRVLSAALPRLAAVTEDDITHFAENYRVDEAVLRQNYYIALGNCMWADIIIDPLVDDLDEQNARTVLYLFLAPAVDANALEQREIIRENTTQKTLALIAEKGKVPVGFAEYLMLSAQETSADK